MFFIAGTKGETSTAGSGEFYCPQCENYTRYLHRQVHQKATVFFVPVANLKLLGEYVECQSCDGTDVCLQKVVDKSGIKIREGFRFQIPFSKCLSNH